MNNLDQVKYFTILFHHYIFFPGKDGLSFCTLVEVFEWMFIFLNSCFLQIAVYTNLKAVIMSSEPLELYIHIWEGGPQNFEQSEVGLQ